MGSNTVSRIIVLATAVVLNAVYLEEQRAIRSNNHKDRLLWMRIYREWLDEQHTWVLIASNGETSLPGEVVKGLPLSGRMETLFSVWA